MWKVDIETAADVLIVEHVFETAAGHWLLKKWRYGWDDCEQKLVAMMASCNRFRVPFACNDGNLLQS